MIQLLISAWYALRGLGHVYDLNRKLTIQVSAHEQVAKRRHEVRANARFTLERGLYETGFDNPGYFMPLEGKRACWLVQML